MEAGIEECEASGLRRRDTGAGEAAGVEVGPDDADTSTPALGVCGCGVEGCGVVARAPIVAVGSGDGDGPLFPSGGDSIHLTSFGVAGRSDTEFEAECVGNSDDGTAADDDDDDADGGNSVGLRMVDALMAT